MTLQRYSARRPTASYEPGWQFTEFQNVERSIGGVTTQLGNQSIVPLADYATGGGVGDQTDRIRQWYSDIPLGGLGTIQRDRYKFSSGSLSFNEEKNIVGEGPGSCLVPDLGPLTDAVVVNNTASANLYYLRLDNFSILNGTVGCCRYGLVINRLFISEVNLHVKIAAAQYNVLVSGSELSYFRFVSSGNAAYPAGYTSGLGAVGTVLVKYDAVNSIACNANFFDVIAEGGGNAFWMEDQLGQGNNWVRIRAEGLTYATRSFYAKGATGIKFFGSHIESNGTAPAELENCASSSVESSIFTAQAPNPAELRFTGCDNVTVEDTALDSFAVTGSTGPIYAGKGFRYGTVNGKAGAITDASNAIVYEDQVSTAIPTTGFYMAGQFVRKAVPVVAGGAGSQYVIEGWRRVTTGSAHVLNTDWVEARTLTGT